MRRIPTRAILPWICLAALCAQPARAGAEDGEAVLRRRMIKRLGPQELTLEQQREAEDLSRAAAAMGTDPTAIIGRVQAVYNHDALSGGAKSDSLVERIDIPYHGNLVLRVDVPYAWVDPNRPPVPKQSGLTDIFVRTGGRFYSAPGYAFFAGSDFTFPTTDNRLLGTGKYTIGPLLATARFLPRIESLLFAVLQHQLSVGGDPSRPPIGISRFSLAFNTVWARAWWTQVSPLAQVDWERNGKSSMVLEFEGGRRLARDWAVWVRPGVGLWGRDVAGAYDWTVLTGLRRTFPGF